MMQDDFIRPDGRRVDELRDLTIEVGVLHNADGSAQVKLGRNIVLAAVNGPMEMHPKHKSMSQKAVVRINYRMMPFSVEYRKNPYPSRREKEISKVLSEAFESVVITEMYPRSAIDVHVQMIQSDGGSRTAASIAVSAALADAGIPMRGFIAGIASGLYEGRCCLDLSGIEDNVGSGDMPILYAPALDAVALFQLDGRFTLEDFKTCYQMSIETTKKIEQMLREALKKKYLAVKEMVTSIETDTTPEEVSDSVNVQSPDEITAAAEVLLEERVEDSSSPETPTGPSTDTSAPVMSPLSGTAEPSETSVISEGAVESPPARSRYIPPQSGVASVTSETVPEESPVKDSEGEVVQISDEPPYYRGPIGAEAPEEKKDEGAGEESSPLEQEVADRYSLDVSFNTEEKKDLDEEEKRKLAEKRQTDLEIQDFELGDE